MNTLKAEKRNMNVKARRLRREGFVTGNLFGRELQGSIPLKIAKRDVEQLLKTERKGGQVMLEIDGQTYDALIKEIDYNAMARCVEEIDFQALISNEKVHSVAEVVLLNHEKAIEGVLQEILKEISYKAVPAALVEKVIVDVGNMRAGDSLRVKDLEISQNKDIELMTDPEAVVVSVSAVHNSLPDDTEEEETQE